MENLKLRDTLAAKIFELTEQKSVPSPRRNIT